MILRNKIKVEIPTLLKGKVNELIGKTALDYLVANYKNAFSVKDSNACKCNNVPMKLPCCHQLVNSMTQVIQIPEEYLRFKCNYLEEGRKNLQRTECRVETVNMEEEELDLRTIVKLLYQREDTLHFRNKLAYMGWTFLKYGRIHIKPKKRRWNPSPGVLSFSYRSTAHVWNRKRLRLRKFIVKPKKNRTRTNGRIVKSTLEPKVLQFGSKI